MKARPWTCSNWCAYVGSGKSREERAERLKECPEEWQESVRKHVECLFRVAAQKKKMEGRT